MPRFSNVLLVNPAYSTSVFSVPFLPAGLGYVAQSLWDAGVCYQVMDMGLGFKENQVLSRIDEKRFDLIGISIMSYMLKSTFALVKSIKMRFPDIPIVVGGPHVTSVKGEVLCENRDLDYAVVGEGEKALVELCRGDEFGGIKGLGWRRNGEVVVNEGRPFEEDLDSLTFPTYEGFELSKYGYGIGIVGSRGCPYSCVYCSCQVIGKKFRARSPESIVGEIQYWYDRGYREFGFQEDNPTFNRERMVRLCDEIQKRNWGDVRIMCGNGVRADRTDYELLKQMRESGFKRLAFGVESACDHVLKSIKKGTSFERIDEAVKNASGLGFYVRLFFLVGSPGERAVDVEKSIEFALKYPVSDVSFFNLVPMPGSELYEWIEKNGYFLVSPDKYLNQDPHPARGGEPLFFTPEFSKNERVAMLRKTAGVARRIRKNLISKKFGKLGVFALVVAWVYTHPIVTWFEHFFLANKVFRKVIHPLRMRVRNLFYK